MELPSSLVAQYPEIQEMPVCMSIPVLWGDMDSASHVNNLVYLRWTESARIKLFGQFMETSFQGSLGLILGWHDCKYIFPMTYPDTAITTARIQEIKTDRFMIVSKVYSVRHSKISALSYQSMIPYDYVQLKKIPIPESRINKLSRLN